MNGYDYTVLSSSRIQLALKGISDNDPPSCPKEPITFDMLQDIFPLLPGDYDTLVVWSAITIAFFGGALGQEKLPYLLSTHQNENSFVRLCDVQLIDLPNVQCLKQVIKCTKTKPHGIVVMIGCSHSQVCALCSLKSYHRARGIISTVGNYAPLYILANGRVLHKDLFVQKTKLFVSAIGKKPVRYSGHSFRSGSASTASNHGFYDYEIKCLGH